MANIRRIVRDKGVTYKITVMNGRDLQGKQVRHYKTWVPPDDMSPRQMEKEVQKIAYEFERELLQGFVVDDRQTFAEYAEYVLNLKKMAGLKHRTLERYHSLMKRINESIGYMKLNAIRPQHLNLFYDKLSQEGVRESQQKAVPKKDLKKLAKSKKLSIAEMSRITGVAASSMSPAMNGKAVSMPTAEAIAEALGQKVDKLFYPTKDTSPLSCKTILEYHRLISTIMTQAEKEMIITFNPARLATPPKQKRTEADYFQPEEIIEILACLDEEPIQWKTLTHLLIITGCRRGEIMGLHWRSVNWEKRTICIECALLYTPEQGVYEDTTKTSETRYISLPEETMKLLRHYRAWQAEKRLACGMNWQDSDYVFTRDDGSPMRPDSITQWLTRFANRHDLPEIHPHKFRHSSASILINNGIDIVAVSKRLGHAKVSTTTDIYSHIIKKADEGAADSIAETLLRRHA